MENSNKRSEHQQPNVHNDKAREDEVSRQRKQERHDAEDADRQLVDGERTEIDATHGDDAIEIARNEGRRFTESQEFTPFHGDLGDESEDMGDLSLPDRKNKNFYNSAASVGENQQAIEPDAARGMQIKRGRQAGISHKDEDSYVNEDKEQGKKQK